MAGDETFVVPSDTAINVDFRAGFEQLVLRVNADALLKKLAALIGTIPSRALVFDSAQVANEIAVGSLRRMLLFFASELDSAGTQPPPRSMLTELEQVLIVSFLYNNPNNYSKFIESDVRPAASWQVKRAEEYIEANWDKPITIEALASITSTSARSLFHQFKRRHALSPMVFVKHVRLQRAREMLARDEPSTSVTDAAFACGFSNLGHFAKDYLKRFGERPSDTLKRVKGRLTSS